MDETAPHPGRILLDEVMTPLGVSRNQLARDIDVPVGRISAIVSGARAITADTALRLARYFGTTPELWLRLQADYDLARAREQVGQEVEERVRVLHSRAPLADEPPAAPDPLPAADETGEPAAQPEPAAVSDEPAPPTLGPPEPEEAPLAADAAEDAPIILLGPADAPEGAEMEPAPPFTAGPTLDRRI